MVSPVAASGTSQVTVHVTSAGGTPVSGASVSLSATGGSLNPTTGTSDANGDFKLTYTAPGTDGTYTISATASKTGYKNGSGSDQIIVAPILTPNIVFTGTESYTANGKQWIRYNLAIANLAKFPPELFYSAPDLPPCGLNTNASRTWVNIYNAKDDSYIYGFCGLSSLQDMTSIWFTVEQGMSPPAGVYVVFEDRRTNKRYISNSVSP